ncbi:DNA repair exonuclease [Kribbella sandramycini]|uniref:DNA repair exonuclease n=1 Tax=Kribbella sandramycini TaxID=60450 RepID=A0A7Y4KYW7_9ACTN|nr:metallophosphoesterase [Kribbella sandramycini]MBB6568912.1 DNA repair exonuclease SbcCD nuclease subunit [Kribbella sandramycini]NOL41242.1 DNA repair exonuclease [Kribbella sandramycini]
MEDSITFLHSSDWQLGMMRRFLGPDGQARWGQGRLDAVARIGAVATESNAAFVVVTGDVFEHNQVERQTILRACEALKRIPVPVVLLPGNHDALEPGSLWTSSQWQAHAPAHVTVVTDTAPFEVVPGVEIVGAPWRSRRPLSDPAAPGYADLQPAPAGTTRILLVHGQLTSLSGGMSDVPTIDQTALEAAVTDGRVHYVGLGDRHSTTRVTDRIWFSGTQEVTTPEETDPGNVLKVTIGSGITVEPVRVGAWHMVDHKVELYDEESLTALEDWFAELPDKERTYVRLAGDGSLPLPLLSRLDALIDAQGEVFASVERWTKFWTVRPAPDAADLDALQLSGPARAAMEELRQALAGGDEAAGAALSLMHRLARDAG